MHKHWAWVGLAALMTCTGCTGLALGRSAPGADVSLAYGAVAVDARTDTAFVLQKRSHDNEVVEQRLYAVAANDNSATQITAMQGEQDPRMLFPDSGVLVMTEKWEGERLMLLDPISLKVKRDVRIDARYHGTRLSPSRRWLAVADNDQDTTPIHIVDTKTLRPRVVPHKGDWLEATWLNESDRLVAAIFNAGTEGAPATVRIVSWTVDDVAGRDYSTDTSGVWANPDLDHVIQGKQRDAWLSFTWLGVSPDDRWLVVPVRNAETQIHELVLVDLRDGSHRVLPNAKGPVGFTADSRTIISYDRTEVAPNADDDESRTHVDGLLLVDAETLETRRLHPPHAAGFQFYVSGSTVVVAPTALEDPSQTHAPLFVVDANDPQDDGTTVPGSIHLAEFLERPAEQELWVISHAALTRVDLDARTSESVAVGFSPAHLNYLPGRDWLVLDEPSTDASASVQSLVFVDPSSRQIVRRVPVPTR